MRCVTPFIQNTQNGQSSRDNVDHGCHGLGEQATGTAAEGSGFPCVVQKVFWSAMHVVAQHCERAECPWTVPFKVAGVT